MRIAKSVVLAALTTMLLVAASCGDGGDGTGSATEAPPTALAHDTNVPTLAPATTPEGETEAATFPSSPSSPVTPSPEVTISPDVTMPPAAVAGLPAAWPAVDAPWGELGEGWILAIVHGLESEGSQAQGLYLVGPSGERWVINAQLTDPRVTSMTQILDWSPNAAEALIMMSGPRDIERVQLVDLQSGALTRVTDDVGGGHQLRAGFVQPSGEDLVSLEFDFAAGTHQLVHRSRDGSIVRLLGTDLPIGTHIDWTFSFDGSSIVVLDGLDVGGVSGRVIRYGLDPATENVLALEDCLQVAWLRTTELVVACEEDGPGSPRSLSVLPMDGSGMWRLGDHSALASLDIERLTDLDMLDGSLILKSGASQLVTMANEAAPILLDLGQDAVPPNLDLVGVSADRIVVRRGQTLESYKVDGSDRQELLSGVVDATLLKDAPLTTGGFPSPPLPAFVGDTKPKSGDGSFALLADVRWASHESYTRVVFEFVSEASQWPNWSVLYRPGSAEPRNPPGETLSGEGLLWVELTPSSGLDITDPNQTVRTYEGASRIEVSTNRVSQIALMNDFEAYLAWVIEVDGQQPFRVLTASEPVRVIVDIAE